MLTEVVGGNREIIIICSRTALGQIVAPIDHNLHTKDFQLVKEMIIFLLVAPVLLSYPTTAIIDWNLFSSTTTGAGIPQ